jgi:rhodanese-related sulfurtransferase
MNIKHKLILLTLAGLLLSSFSITGGCMIITGEGTPTQPPEPQIYDVTVDKAYDLIRENAGNPDFIIIDVRTQEEYNSGYIKGAINIDFYSEDFRTELDALDRDKVYLIYCHTARRSSGARDMMAELGFKEVYNMSGGIVVWETQGRPVVR